MKGLATVGWKNYKPQKGDKWIKFHSCCDWIYVNKRNDQAFMFCGLKPNRKENMKKFEKIIGYKEKNPQNY